MEINKPFGMKNRLPDKFLQRIHLTFKEQGRKWLEEIDAIIMDCMKKWEITGIEPVKELSYNLVCTAYSSKYGKIILKLCAPNADHRLEAAVLKQYRGKGICRLYDYDPVLGALVLEHMETMEDLRSVADFRERIAVGARITYEMPVEADEKMSAMFPSYRDWTDRAFALVRSHPLADERFLCYVETAEALLMELERETRPPLLLHGDLHHMNILWDRGSFKAIDPQGVIGVLPQNAARFMENEMDIYERTPEEAEAALQAMLSYFAEIYSERPEIMLAYLYVDQMLSTAWHMEDEEMTEELKKSRELCDLIEKIRRGES